MPMSFCRTWRVRYWDCSLPLMRRVSDKSGLAVLLTVTVPLGLVVQAAKPHTQRRQEGCGVACCDERPSGHQGMSCGACVTFGLHILFQLFRPCGVNLPVTRSASSPTTQRVRPLCSIHIHPGNPSWAEARRRLCHGRPCSCRRVEQAFDGAAE